MTRVKVVEYDDNAETYQASRPSPSECQKWQIVEHTDLNQNGLVRTYFLGMKINCLFE